MSKSSYYTDVVRELLLYREYKQRVIMIRQEEEKKTEVARKTDRYTPLTGIDYDRILVQTSNISDNTAEIALKNISEKIYNEFRYKLDLVKKIEIAYSGLDEVEKFIIRKKYMTGRVEVDKYIYINPEYKYGRSKYYEIKDEAVKKLARIRGYL